MLQDRQKQLVMLYITGIIIVVIVAILAIISVWSKNGESIKESQEYKVGRITIDKLANSEDYVKRYYSKIEKYLIEENYDEMYSLLSEDFIEYANMTKENMKEYLASRKILNQALVLKSYEKFHLNGFSNIYVLNIKQKDGIYDLIVLVRETSPNDFSISFDGYIMQEKLDYNSTINGVNLKINSVVYFSNYIEYDVTIKNVYDNTIVINSKHVIEPINIKLNNNSLIAPYSTVFGSKSVELLPNKDVRYKIKYNIQNEDLEQIQSIVIKDIYYNGKDVTEDAEFVF